jgi:hypothetical protein
MILGLSADSVAAATGIITLVGAIVGGYFRLAIRNMERDIVTLEKERDAELDKIEVLTERLAQVEKTYISRADHAEFKAELMAAVREVGEKLERGIDGLRRDIREDLHDFNSRVSALEKAS